VQYSGGDTFFLDGVLDEVRIWSTARTGTQINDFKSVELTGTETGLKAYYPFEPIKAEMDLNDTTSNNNDLTNYGASAVTTSLPFGGSTKAADLEAVQGSYLTAPDSASLSATSNLTLETWIKFESLPSSGNVMQLISKNYDSGNQRSYALGLWNDSGTYKLRFVYSTDGTYQSANDVSTTWTPSTGTWYHVASVLDTSVPNVKFYVNGTQQGSTITSNTGTSIYNSTALLYVGAVQYSLGDTFYLDGMLDDVRIWNAARTGTQINDYKSAELAGTESGLVAYYTLDSN
jgi:large repetitive protein